MKRIILISIIGILTGSGVFAQQDVLYSQYMFDKMLVNPGAAGSSSWMVASLKNRTSMLNIEGAPMSNFFTFEVPFQGRNIGAGLKVVQDNISVNQHLNASGFFSYHIGFGSGKLSFGLEAGMMSNGYDYRNLIRWDPTDSAIPDDRTFSLVPDASTGLYYQNQHFYLGVSGRHLFNWKNIGSNSSRNDIMNLSQTYYGIGGYMIEIGNNFILEPGFLVKYSKASPVQVDGNLSFIMLDRFAVGFSYRSGDAIIAMAKIDITRNIKIAYSYDYTISQLSNYSSGCHEISISYGIEIPPPPEKKIIHPRYYF